MKKFLFPAVVIALLLSGCAGVSGEVTDKRVDPEKRTTVQKPLTSTSKSTSCTGTGASKKCSTSTSTKTTGSTPSVSVDDEDFVLVVTDDEGKTHEVDVDREEYDAAQVGDRYGDE